MVIARCNIKSPQPQSPLKMFFFDVNTHLVV